MKLESNPVVVPASDLNDMVQAIRTFLTKKATANCPTSFLIQLSNLGKSDWVNDNVDHIKEYANRTFLDDWPMPKYK